MKIYKKFLGLIGKIILKIRYNIKYPIKILQCYENA